VTPESLSLSVLKEPLYYADFHSILLVLISNCGRYLPSDENITSLAQLSEEDAIYPPCCSPVLSEA